MSSSWIGSAVVYRDDERDIYLTSPTDAELFYDLFAEENFKEEGEYILYGMPDLRLASSVLRHPQVHKLTVIDGMYENFENSQRYLSLNTLRDQFGERLEVVFFKHESEIFNTLKCLKKETRVRWYGPSLLTMSQEHGVLKRWLYDLQLKMNSSAIFEVLEKNIKHNRSLSLPDFYKYAKGFSCCTPAVILMGGPSLRGSLGRLKDRRSEFMVISSGRNGRILEEYGIVPDFWIEMDGQNRPEIWSRLEHCNSSSPLIMLDSASVLVHRFFKGERIVVRSSDYPGEPETSGGGKTTAGALALEVAAVLGATSIYMVGQDLCYIDGVSHSEGGGVSPFFAGDISCYDGERRPSSKEFFSFQRSLEMVVSGLSVPVYSCSFKGAIIRGVEYRSI